MEPPVRSREAGFVLVEAVVAIAIVGLSTGAVLAAVCAVQHATAAVVQRAALTLTAQNIITDLRAATAYDAAQLAAVRGRSVAFDVAEAAPDGAPLSIHVAVTIDRSAPTSSAVATVSVRDGRGETVTLQSSIVQQAPAPGSLVPADPPCESPQRCVDPAPRLAR